MKIIYNFVNKIIYSLNKMKKINLYLINQIIINNKNKINWLNNNNKCNQKMKKNCILFKK